MMKLLTIQELAELLNAKVTTIYSWINRGSVPYLKFTVNGETIRRSTETKERRLAEKIYCKVVTQVTEGKWFDLPHRTKKRP